MVSPNLDNENTLTQKQLIIWNQTGNIDRGLCEKC